MVTQDLGDSLAGLVSCLVRISAAYEDQRVEDPAIQLLFSDGSRLRADYWRVIQKDKEVVSSFDHRQKYGLPQPIDAIAELSGLLNQSYVAKVRLDTRAGDLLLSFLDGIDLQIFGFTHYEAWEVHFPSGTGEYSNYLK